MTKANKENTTTKEVDDEEEGSNLPSVVTFSEDLNDAEAPIPLPAGEYEAEIKAVEIKVSNSGNRYAACTFFISPEQYPADYADDGDPNGEAIIYRRASIEDNPKSRYVLRQFIEAINAPLGKRIDTNQWLGCRARVTVTNEPYEDTMKANISKVSAL